MFKKGLSTSLQFLVGLVVTLIILIIVFKILGILAAQNYENQAQITTKNLQTAINYVCATGQSREIELNLPQELSESGVSPLQTIWFSFKTTITKGAIKGPDMGAVLDMVRYTTALQSYGDPWFVVYYENFPHGEDSGWTGWNEVAAMRMLTTYIHGVDIASCVGSALLPFFGSAVKRVGKIAKRGIIKGTTKLSESKAVSKISEIFKGEKFRKTLDYILEIKGVSSDGAKKLFVENIGAKIIKFGEKIKSPYKRGIDKIWEWIGVRSKDEVMNHLSVAQLADSYVDDMAEITSRKSFVYTYKVRYDIKDLSEKINKLRYSEITHSEAKQILEDLKNYNFVDIYGEETNAVELLAKDYSKTITGKEVENFDEWVDDLYASYLYNYGRDDFPKKTLKDLYKKLQDGEELTDNEIKLVRNLRKYPELDNSGVLDVFEDVGELSKTKRELGKLDLSNFIADSTPYEYTRLLVGAMKENERVSGLKKIAAYTTTHFKTTKSLYALRGGVKYTFKKSSPRIITQEGTWVGGTYFLSKALTVAEISSLKFYPCSDDALCVKSAVNPSITVYPLKDCRERGIEWIELDKHPYEGEIGDVIKNKLDSVGSYILGTRPISKFYTASPCKGRLKIEKTKCNCELHRIPYIDLTSLDLFMIECEINHFNKNTLELDATCSMKKDLTYLSEYEEVYEDIGEFQLPQPAVSEIDIDGDGSPEGYSISSNLKSVFENIENFEGYGDELLNQITCESAIHDKGGDIGDKFECEPIGLPPIVFYYHECDSSSNYWFECVDWKMIERDVNIEKDTLSGKVEVPAKKWCCTQWNLGYYPNGIDNIGQSSYKIINSTDYGRNCVDEYIDINIINNNIDTTLNNYGITNNEYKSTYMSSFINTILKGSEVILPEDLNPNDPSVNILYKHNLPATTQTDCIKISYSGDDTSGFCYTSPTALEDVESGLIFTASMAVDIGVQALLDMTGIGVVASGFVGCMAGNVVWWYGEYVISEQKQKYYWPHNLFFKEYLN